MRQEIPFDRSGMLADAVVEEIDLAAAAERGREVGRGAQLDIDLTRFLDFGNFEDCGKLDPRNFRSPAQTDEPGERRGSRRIFGRARRHVVQGRLYLVEEETGRQLD